MKLKVPITLAVIFLITLSNCVKEEVLIEYSYYDKGDYEIINQYLNLPNDAVDYSLNFPDYYSSRIRNFNNGMATLGRVLFYDINLSEDRSISCASCHKQELAFSDDLAFSDGVLNRKTTRNSLALGSVFSFREYYGSMSSGRVPFFWDNRASTVQEQSKQTLANEVEMSMNMHEVVERVKEQAYYYPLFRTAFRSAEISEDNVLDAISEFINSMATFNSKYDEGLEAHFAIYRNFNNLDEVDVPGLTAQENLGKTLYVTNCGSCHGNVNGMPGELAANNGLEMNYSDPGMGDVTNYTGDLGVFKVPTLRNIVKTAPYMHDGRFQTLEAVIDHYSNGIQNFQNLSIQLREGEQPNAAPKKFNFSQEEKTALIVFFNTFTDEEFLIDEKFSDPFK